MLVRHPTNVPCPSPSPCSELGEEPPGPTCRQRDVAGCLRQLLEAEAALARLRVSLAALQKGEDAAFTTMLAGSLAAAGNGGTLGGPDAALPALSVPLAASVTSTLTSEMSRRVASKDSHRAYLLYDQVVLASVHSDTHFDVYSHASWGVDHRRSVRRSNGHSAAPARWGGAGPFGSILQALERKLSAVLAAVVAFCDISWEPAGRIKVPVFHPEGKCRVMWTMVGLLFIIFEAFAVPLYMAMDLQASGGLFVFVSIINVYFLLDILMSFLCGFMGEGGIVVRTPSKVAVTYAKTWMVPDLVAAIPWEWVDSTSGGEGVARSVKAIRAVRLLRNVRLLRLMKLGRLIDRLEAFLESNHAFLFMLGVGRIIFVLVIVCHWSACVWYSLGLRNYDEKYAGGEPASWMVRFQHIYPFVGESKSEQYMASVYFTLTTMTTVGYGDITASNSDEVSFVIFLLFLSSMLFASLMGTLSDMLSAFNHRKHMLAEKKLVLRQYMRWRSVPWKLMVGIRQHLLFMWDTNEGYDAYEEGLKAQLPPVLKAELCYHIYGRVLTSAPFLQWMADFPICMKQLAEKVQSLFLERGDRVFRIGQVNDRIYMLLNGTIVVSKNDHLFGEEDHVYGSSARRPSLTGNVLIPRQKAKRLTQMVPTKWSKDRGRAGRRRGGVGSPFDSETLVAAGEDLRRRDMHREVAARRLQLAWRRKLMMRVKNSSSDGGSACSPSVSRKRSNVDLMQKAQITAPAYFGESCLWQPFEEWDQAPPPLYVYTAVCNCRGELVYIPRAAVKELLEGFDSWLPERLELFRKAVQRKVARFMGEEHKMPSTESWGTQASRGIGSGDMWALQDPASDTDAEEKVVQVGSTRHV